MNSMGIAGAASSQLMVGPVVAWYGGRAHPGRYAWDPAFHVYVMALIVAAYLWYKVDPCRPVFEATDDTLGGIPAEGHA
jgi:hypothetical protein